MRIIWRYLRNVLSVVNAIRCSFFSCFVCVCVCVTRDIANKANQTNSTKRKSTKQPFQRSFQDLERSFRSRRAEEVSQAHLLIGIFVFVFLFTVGFFVCFFFSSYSSLFYADFNEKRYFRCGFGILNNIH